MGYSSVKFCEGSQTDYLRLFYFLSTLYVLNLAPLYIMNRECDKGGIVYEQHV